VESFIGEIIIIGDFFSITVYHSPILFYIYTSKDKAYLRAGQFFLHFSAALQKAFTKLENYIGAGAMELLRVHSMNQ
jgi:hypothetical protein